MSPDRKHVFIAGANSAIAEACARRWARDGALLFLAARDCIKLTALVADLRGRYGENCIAGTLLADFSQIEKLESVIHSAKTALNQHIDIALIAHGTLPDQKLAEEDPEYANQSITVNANSTIALCGHLANQLDRQGSGCLVVITSVAGDRIRRSNYVYGSSKAMIQLFLEGLGMRLQLRGVQVVDVRPGFVISPMTEGMSRTGILWTEPDVIAKGLISAVEAKRRVVYLPGRWRWIMALVRMIPYRLLLRLKF